MDPNEKRNGSRFRKKRSIVFQKQLSNCQRQHQGMKVMSVRKVNKDKFTFVIKSAQVTEANITYDMFIGKSPSCSCPIGLLTKRTVLLMVRIRDYRKLHNHSANRTYKSRT